jgi:hypothetical protein
LFRAITAHRFRGPHVIQKIDAFTVNWEFTFQLFHLGLGRASARRVSIEICRHTLHTIPHLSAPYDRLAGTQSWSASIPIVRLLGKLNRRHVSAGSLLFCPDCGTLLSLPRDGETVVICEQCSYEEPASCEFVESLVSTIEALITGCPCSSLVLPLFSCILNVLAYENVSITTRSDPEAFPSALRQKRKTQTKHHDTGDQGTLVRCRTVVRCFETNNCALQMTGI